MGSFNAWHRVSILIKNVMPMDARATVGHYVDNFFRVCSPGLEWNTPKVPTLLCDSLGAPCDPAKADYSMARLMVVGAGILINFESWSYHHRVVPAKAKQWAAELQEIVNSSQLNFANQLAHGRFGHALLQPLYRGIDAPLPYNHITVWTSMVILRWI